jgi:hypothetical protein
MKKTIKLYVNDPLGSRCEMNLQAARRVIEETGVELVIIKKNSDEYFMESYPPPCPSVAVGDRLIVKDGTVGYEELKTELLKEP